MALQQRPLPPQVVAAMRRQMEAAPGAQSAPPPSPDQINELLEALKQFSVNGGLKLFTAMASVDAQDNTVAVGAVSAEVSGARKRQYLFIANVGANDIRVSFGKPATSTSGLVIAGTGFIEPLRPFSSSINALSSAGSTLLLIEG